MSDQVEGEAFAAEEDPDPFRILGQTLRGKYQITRLIGQGGMGVVYEATHLRLDRRCALKFIKLGTTRFPQKVLDRFLREARIGAHLQHPGIVEVFDVEEHSDGSPYIVMEFLEGQSLGDRCRDGKMEWSEVFDIVARASIPLAAAHARGIIHRDIKPDNLFLCSDGTIKVLDFGIAHFDNDQPITQTGNVMGTPHFMSREQISAAKDIDGRADIYSLGVVMYRCITGQDVFTADNYVALLVKLASEIPTDIQQVLPSLPAHAAAVVRKAMTPDRAGRYQTMDELRAEIEESLAMAGIAFPAVAPPRAPTAGKRDPLRQPSNPSDFSAKPPPRRTLSLADADSAAARQRSNPFDQTHGEAAAPPVPNMIVPPSSPALPRPRSQPSLDTELATVVKQPSRALPIAIVAVVAIAVVAVGGFLLFRHGDAPTTGTVPTQIPTVARAAPAPVAPPPAAPAVEKPVTPPTAPVAEKVEPAPAAVAAKPEPAPRSDGNAAMKREPHHASKPAAKKPGDGNKAAGEIAVPGYKDVD